MARKTFKVFLGIIAVLIFFIFPFFAGMGIAQFMRTHVFDNIWVLLGILCIGIIIGWIANEVSTYLSN